jgi:hypothetical protein
VPEFAAWGDTVLGRLVEGHDRGACVPDANIRCILRRVKAIPTSSWLSLDAMKKVRREKNIHFIYGNPRAIRVDVTTFLKEIFGNFDGI